jgi:hypothetical protein
MMRLRLRERLSGWPTIGISVAAGLIAFWALYGSDLKPADVRIYPAETLHFGYETENGALKVTVPCLLANHGAKHALVQCLGLVIRDPSRLDDIVFLKWEAFQEVEVEPGSIVWSVTDAVNPISLGKNASVFRYVRFHGQEEVIGWVPEPRTYELTLVAWVGSGSLPDLRTHFQVTFSPEECEALRNWSEEGRGLAMQVMFEEWGKWTSKMLSATELNQLMSAETK